jgi:hypothetical protein
MESWGRERSSSWNDNEQPEGISNALQTCATCEKHNTEDPTDLSTKQWNYPTHVLQASQNAVIGKQDGMTPGVTYQRRIADFAVLIFRSPGTCLKPLTRLTLKTSVS